MNWITLEKYPLYEINNKGEIRNKRTKKLKKYYLNKDGYFHTFLYKNSTIQQPTHLTVHRLVAETFLPNPNNYNCINHIDENKTNNDINNLEWCSQKHNRNNYIKSNGVNSMAKKSVIKIDKNNNIVECYKSLRQASKNNNINLTTLCRGIKKEIYFDNYKYKYKESEEIV